MGNVPNKDDSPGKIQDTLDCMAQAPAPAFTNASNKNTSAGSSTNRQLGRVCWGCSDHVSSCTCDGCYGQALYDVTHPDYDPYATDYSSTEIEDDGIIENYCKECQEKLLDYFDRKNYDPFEVERGIELFQELWRDKH